MKEKSDSEIVPKLRILTVRDQRVLLDADLARLYGVETRVLNQAVKRNPDRFPEEFAFALTREEILSISQTVTSLVRLKFSKSVHAFTEHGAFQAAGVVNSPQAVQMSLYVIRAFVKMREQLAANTAILKRLAEIDKTLLEHDSALRVIWDKLQPVNRARVCRFFVFIGHHGCHTPGDNCAVREFQAANLRKHVGQALTSP